MQSTSIPAPQQKHQAEGCRLAEEGSSSSETVEVKKNNLVFTSDGKCIGRVYDITEDDEGTPRFAQIIYRGRMLNIAIDMLSEGDKSQVTSLTWDEIR